MSEKRTRDDRGETLLELIVSITILGVCVVAIGAGIALSIKLSAIHRAQATADAFLHNYAESLQNSYTACAGGTPPNYAASLAQPSGFNPPTASVMSWNGTRFVPGCLASDPGLQEVTLRLDSADGFVSESVTTVLRSAT